VADARRQPFLSGYDVATASIKLNCALSPLKENSMSNVMSYAEITGQYVELLPARTVLSVFRLDDDTSFASVCVGGTAQNQTLLLFPSYQSSVTCMPTMISHSHHVG
jgi:hypothetical protein